MNKSIRKVIAAGILTGFYVVLLWVIPIMIDFRMPFIIHGVIGAFALFMWAINQLIRPRD